METDTLITKSYKPAKIRLGFLYAYMNSKYDTYEELADDVNRVIKLRGLNLTKINYYKISKFLHCTGGFVPETLNIIKELLHVRDSDTIREVFTEPKDRMCGKQWIGNFGTVVTDIEYSGR